VELVQGAKYPDPIEKQEGVPETEKQDITVIPPPLPLFGESEKPGG
jgi:hypothetical protein